MRIRFHKKFLKQLAKAPKDVQIAVDRRLDLFSSNPQHPLLRDHALTGNYEGLRSINISGDCRAVYEQIDSLSDGIYAHFISLGTHSQLYR